MNVSRTWNHLRVKPFSTIPHPASYPHHHHHHHHPSLFLPTQLSLSNPNAFRPPEFTPNSGTKLPLSFSFSFSLSLPVSAAPSLPTCPSAFPGSSPDSRSAGGGRLCTALRALAAGTGGKTIVGRLGVRRRVSEEEEEGLDGVVVVERGSMSLSLSLSLWLSLSLSPASSRPFRPSYPGKHPRSSSPKTDTTTTGATWC